MSLAPLRSSAQPAPGAGAIFPMGAQRGASVDITFFGSNLADVDRVIVSGAPGVTGEILDRPTPETTLVFSGEGVRVNDRDASTARARITVAADAALGERELRVASPAGVSRPVKLQVGPYPEIMESFQGESLEKAQEIKFPVTVNGKISQKAESDFFRFAGAKGQRMIFEVTSFRMGSPLDAILILYGAEGKELAREEDTLGLDPLLDFTLPADGTYAIELRDLRHKGGADYVYRLTAGEIPFLDGVFPLGGSAGQELQLKLLGRNLKGADTMPLSIGRDAGAGLQEIRATTASGFSNARMFDVSRVNEITEAEPNPALENATPAAAFPSALNGRIDEPGDVDVYKIALPPGRRVAIEALAQRLGSSLDALLTLTDKDGKELARNDDAAGGDSRIEFAAENENPVYLQVADLLGRGGEPYAYRVKIQDIQPGFSLKYFPDNPALSRGSRVNLRVEIDREAGYTGGGTILEFENLPQGVTASRVVIPADHPASGWITLEASADAQPGIYPIRLVGLGEVGGRRIKRVATAILEGGGVDGDRNNTSRDRVFREGFLVIRDDAPFTLEPITISAQVAQGKSTEIQARVTRRPGFDGPVNLRVEGYTFKREGPGRNFSIEGGAAAPGQDRVTLKLNATANAETQTRPIYLVGVANVNGVERAEQSVTFPLSIYQIPFTMSNNLTRLSVAAMPEGTQSAAGEALLTIKAERRGLFTEPISLEVTGAPEGVTVTAPEIERGAPEANITLKATSKAAPGEYTLSVIGRAEANGQKFEQRTGEIKLTITAPEAPAEEAKE